MIQSSAALSSSLHVEHTTFLRALTSRLGELRGVNAGGVSVYSSEATLLRALQHVRDECHEWTAADMLRSLFSNSSSSSSSNDGQEESVTSWLELDNGSGIRVPLVFGLPAYSWPTYPRVPWAPLLCPVAASLLASCYEDWLIAALLAVDAVIQASTVLFSAATETRVEDLEPPSESASDTVRARHAAAIAAVELLHAAKPLVAALHLAAQTPTFTTATAARSAYILLSRHLSSISHLDIDDNDDDDNDEEEEY